MAEGSFDVIIVGQGLAGTTLAWQLQEAGLRVLVIDAVEPVTSSKIAAGLITPITGQRLVLDPQFETFLEAARAFYASVEKRTGESFFHERIALRLFTSDAERKAWPKRTSAPDYRAHLLHPQPDPLLEPELGDAGGGGFAMHAAQLDVAAYLAASRTNLTCERMQVDWQRDVIFGPQVASVRGITADLVVSCEGQAAAENPWLSNLPFNAAKGDILTVRFDQPVPARTVHRGIWLAPTAEQDIFSIGSTYDWARLDREPDPDARREIEGKLNAFFHVPYSVLDHRAAVRPILAGNRVAAGLHPTEKRLGFFNGLGSKGSLLAPYHAGRLAASIVTGPAVTGPALPESAGPSGQQT